VRVFKLSYQCLLTYVEVYHCSYHIRSSFIGFYSYLENIKDHQYKLFGEKNRTTTWGVWSPAQLNLNESWSDDRGLNSLQLLAYLLSAYRLTGDSQFLTAYKVSWPSLYC